MGITFEVVEKKDGVMLCSSDGAVMRLCGNDPVELADARMALIDGVSPGFRAAAMQVSSSLDAQRERAEAAERLVDHWRARAEKAEANYDPPVPDAHCSGNGCEQGCAECLVPTEARTPQPDEVEQMLAEAEGLMGGAQDVYDTPGISRMASAVDEIIRAVRILNARK